MPLMISCACCFFALLGPPSKEIEETPGSTCLWRMMENLAANKSLVPCQSWGGQTDWSTTSAQGSLFNTMTNSQHLSLGLSSEQRYNHRQASNPSCMSNIGTLSSSHHSALSNSLFASTAIPNTSHSISFAQQSPHTSSMLLTSNQGANIPPPALVQTNQARQPCRPQNLPHDPYKASVQPALTHQDLLSRLQEVPVNLVSCGQRASTSQAAFQGGNVFGTAPGYNHSQASSASQEQRQWVPSPHCRGELYLTYFCGLFLFIFLDPND